MARTLSPQETERFYRIWWALLRYANAKLQIIPDLAESSEGETIDIQDAAEIREALWEDDSILEAFIADNPAALPASDLELVASWQQRIAGTLFIVRHLKNHSVFLTEGSPARAYGVLGLVSSIDEILGDYVPRYVNAVLLPFEDRIIFDSLLTGFNIHFGSGITADLNRDYRNAQEREGIITSLRPAPPGEIRKHLQARNAKLLDALKKDLYKTGLSPKMVEQHTARIADFNEYLMAQDAPRLLLDTDAASIDSYLSNLDAKDHKASLTSFKRFARFLFESDRMDPDAAWELQEGVKRLQRGMLPARKAKSSN